MTSPRNTTVDANTRRSTFAVIHDADGSAARAAACEGDCARDPNHHDTLEIATSPMMATSQKRRRPRDVCVRLFGLGSADVDADPGGESADDATTD